MTYRISRKNKVITSKLTNGDRFKVIRRAFKFPTSSGYFWLVAMVASRSRTGNGSEISTTTPTE